MFEAIKTIDSADAAYCEKLAKHFANMGIAPKAADKAINSLVESDAVPSFVPCMATPSMFGLAKPSPATGSAKFESELAFQA